MYRAGRMTQGGDAAIDLGRGTQTSGVWHAIRKSRGLRTEAARRADVDTAAQACQEALPGASISQSLDPGCMSTTAALSGRGRQRGRTGHRQACVQASNSETSLSIYRSVDRCQRLCLPPALQQGKPPERENLTARNKAIEVTVAGRGAVAEDRAKDSAPPRGCETGPG